MGIKELYPFLKSHDLTEYIHLPTKYRHQVLPCDIASTLFRYRTTSETDDQFMAKVKMYLVSFLMAEVHVVFIFDGKAPKDKAAEHQARAEQRDRTEDRLDGLLLLIEDLTLSDRQLRDGVAALNMRIPEIESVESRAAFDLADRKEEWVGQGVEGTQGEDDLNLTLIDQVASRVVEGSTESALRTTLRMVHERRVTRNVKLETHHFKMVQEFMTQYGIPWIQAPGEAEAFACYLVEHHSQWFAPAILSEDSDCLTYGVPYWLSDYSTKDGTCRSLSLAAILDKLAFTSFEQWRDFTILCECDYNKRLPGYGPIKLYKQWIIPGLSLEDFLMSTAKTITGEQLVALKTERCRVMFEHYGQDSVELRDQVLGGAFKAWLSSRPGNTPYWDLENEDAFTRAAIRDQSDVWGNENDEGPNPNGRIAQAWVWPEGVKCRVPQVSGCFQR
jgi:5'-3' exonuclease